MAKYTVEVKTTITGWTTVQVKARGKEEAKKKAIEKLEDEQLMQPLAATAAKLVWCESFNETEEPRKVSA